PGHSDYGRAGLGVVGYDYEDVDILLVQQVLSLVGLDGIVAVRRAYQHFGAQLFCVSFKGISVILPALFFESVEGKTNPDGTGFSIPGNAAGFIGRAADTGTKQNAADGNCECPRQIRSTHSSIP